MTQWHYYITVTNKQDNTRVNASVFCKMTAMFERFWTEVTLEWSLTGMCALMRDQRAPLTETSRTVFTLVWTLT